MAQTHSGDVKLLLTTLGHDLRGPLSVLMLASDLLAKADAAPSSALLARVRRSTERMNDLLMEITQFVRLRFGDGLNPCPESIEAVTLLERVVERIASAYPGRDPVRFEADRCVLEIDPRLAELAICGAISDRLDTGAAPMIRASAGAAMVEIAITDAKPLIGGVNFLSEPTRACLGLYLAAEIARAHGGQATCQSTRASTELTLHLPRLQRHTSSPAGEISSVSRGSPP